MEYSGQLIINAAIQKGQLILQRAEEKAESIIAEAKLRALAETEKIVARAKLEAEGEAARIIAEARGKAEEMARNTKHEVQQLPYDSRKVAVSSAEDQSNDNLGCGNKVCESPSPQAAICVREDTGTQVSQGQPLYLREKVEKNRAKIIYHDIVQLSVSPPIPVDQLFRFYKYLRKIPKVRVLKFKFQAGGGVSIKLRLESGIPLLNILANIPEVQKVSDKQIRIADNDSLHMNSKGECPKIVVLSLRNRASPSPYYQL
jgi:vacuolar-type H+-ATPase subunit H